MNYNKYLIREGKAAISPHLKSVFKKIDTIDKDTANKVIDALNKEKFGAEKVSVSVASS